LVLLVLVVYHLQLALLMVLLQFFQPLHQQVAAVAVMADTMLRQLMVELVVQAAAVATKVVLVVMVLLVKEIMVAINLVARTVVEVVAVQVLWERMVHWLLLRAMRMLVVMAV
jgi:hypothetical protein